MTSLPVARALARSGLAWQPRRGDRFVLPDRGMDGDVFVLSDMTIEAHDFPSGRVLGFNGTTEWALDSVAAEEALWLPGEAQLRTALADAFVCLVRDGQDWVVTTRSALGDSRVADADAEQAYAVALLSLRAGTAREALPVAAHGLARALAALGEPGAPAWSAPSRDGARTIEQAAAAALGHDGVGDWALVLDDLLDVWCGADSGQAAVAEAGARGVLVDLLAGTWDVRAADVLAPHAVAVALEHVRTWSTGTGTGTGTGVDPAGGADTADTSAAERNEREFLRRTGRG